MISFFIKFLYDLTRVFRQIVAYPWAQTWLNSLLIYFYIVMNHDNGCPTLKLTVLLNRLIHKGWSLNIKTSFVGTNVDTPTAILDRD